MHADNASCRLAVVPCCIDWLVLTHHDLRDRSSWAVALAMPEVWTTYGQGETNCKGKRQLLGALRLGKLQTSLYTAKALMMAS